MKYIRTKDGRIIDLQRLIEKEKENPYYTDYEFEEIKNEEDYCYIQWTAIGTKENSQKDQIGMRCQFGASIDSPFIKQADTIEELCDEVVLIENSNERNIVYLQEAYDRIIEYHEQGNYEPRLIGRIKVGLDKKAVAEWKENKQGLYEWVLL